MLKELNKSDFAAPIIKDLGMMKPSPTAKRIMRFVELECTECGAPFTISVDNAKRRQENKCVRCKALPNKEDFEAEFIQLTEDTSIGEFRCKKCSNVFTQPIVLARNNTYGVCGICRDKVDNVIVNGEIDTSTLSYVYTYNPITGTIFNTIRSRALTLSEDGRITINGVAINAIRIAYILHYGINLPNKIWYIHKDGDNKNVAIDNIGFSLNKPIEVCKRSISSKWTMETAVESLVSANVRTREEAKKYPALAWAIRKGRRTELFELAGIEKTCIDWTVALAKKRASKFTTKIDFKKNDPKAYDYAVKYSGHYTEITSHMIPGNKSDNDAIYIWKVVGLEDVYKIGVTSKRLGTERIEHVAQKAGLDYDIITLMHIDSASDLETLLLSKTTKYVFDYKFDGSTEFRVINKEELHLILQMIELNRKAVK